MSGSEASDVGREGSTGTCPPILDVPAEVGHVASKILPTVSKKSLASLFEFVRRTACPRSSIATRSS